MAFSTQKVFFHLPFNDDNPAHECDKACVKMKSYPSSHDGRAWAASDSKKSRFVTDLVACNMPITNSPEKKSDNKKNNASGKKPKEANNKSDKRAGNQSRSPDQRRRVQNDYETKGKQDQNADYGRRSQVRHTRPDFGSRGGLSQRRSSFAGAPQKFQSSSSRRNLGPNQVGQGSTLRKRIYTNPDEESPVRGGRSKMGTSQNPSFYNSLSQEPGRYNQPIVEYPTQDHGGNERYGHENPYVDQLPSSSKGMGQEDQGTDSYKDLTDRSVAPDMEEQRYENYESDYSASKGFAYNSTLQGEGWDKYGRTHLERYETGYGPSIDPAQNAHGVDNTSLRQYRDSYSSNQEFQSSDNRRAQDSTPLCYYRRSNLCSSYRYHLVPRHIQLQRQQAYERLCAYAASHRK